MDISKRLARLLLLAEPVVGLAGWWTWSETAQSPSPHFAYQDAGSGSILHSACNSNNTALFSSSNPFKFELKIKPKPATPLAVTGWWEDDLNTPIASIFYQGADDSIVNAFFTCDYETGEYTVDPDGEFKVSAQAGAPSVHEHTGLAVAELGDAGGYRLFYHDEQGRVCLLAYDDDTDWQYQGPLSKKVVTGMGLAAVQTNGLNVSVVFPHEDEQLAVAKFSDKDLHKWTLESLPTPFEAPAPTNKTESWSMILDMSEKTPLSLPSFDKSAHLGISAKEDATLSIFYIGSDDRLHSLSEKGSSWQADKGMSTKWAKSDKDSAPLAVVSPFESEEVWVYYRSGGKVFELYQDEAGTWVEPQEVQAPKILPESKTEEDADDETNTKDDKEDGTKVEGTSPAKESSGSQLSAGAKAGVGVGVTCGVSVLALVGFFFFRRYRNKAQYDAPKDHSQSCDDEEAAMPENYRDSRKNHLAASIVNQQRVSEEDKAGGAPYSYYRPRIPGADGMLEGWTPQELHSDTRYELSGDHSESRAELEHPEKGTKPESR